MRKPGSGQRSFRGTASKGRSSRASEGHAKGAGGADPGGAGRKRSAFRVKSDKPVTGADRWKQRAEEHAATRQAIKTAKELRERSEGAPKLERRRPLRGKTQRPLGPTVAEPMRIAKAMARAGLCSRREAERWIADGRVSVNGKILKTPAVEVKPNDVVLVDGTPLPVAEPAQLWRYHKPKGLVTTHMDPQGRPTVFDNLPDGLPRVVSIGRLDFNTEGLLLLTNDGELARHLELPSTGWLRRYRVRAKGRVTQVDLDKLKEGVEIEGVRYGPVEAQLDTMQGANMWITVGIREGKNREVRKVLSSLGLEVNRLIRISFGPFQLSELQSGEAEIVRRRVLADQLGPKLASEMGLVDVEKPAASGGPKRRAAKGRKPDGAHE